MTTCWARVTSKDSDLLPQSCAVPWIAHAWLMSTASLPRPPPLGFRSPSFSGFPLALYHRWPQLRQGPTAGRAPSTSVLRLWVAFPVLPLRVYRLPFPCGLPSTGATDGPCYVGDYSPRLDCHCCALGTTSMRYASSATSR